MQVSPLSSRERKPLQHGVLRSSRRKLALIENKLVHHHCAKLHLAHRSEPLFKHCERCVRAIAFAPFRRARSPSTAGQSQMRTIRPIFARNTEFGCGDIDTLRQFRELRTGLNSDPEYARCLCRGKESVSAEVNLERPNLECAVLNPPQTLRDGIDLL